MQSAWADIVAVENRSKQGALQEIYYEGKSSAGLGAEAPWDGAPEQHITYSGKCGGFRTTLAARDGVHSARLPAALARLPVSHTTFPEARELQWACR